MEQSRQSRGTAGGRKKAKEKAKAKAKARARAVSPYPTYMKKEEKNLPLHIYHVHTPEEIYHIGTCSPGYCIRDI